MKISFADYDFTDFNVKEGVFCGIPAKLITPQQEAKFTQQNKIFRSSIWDLEGNLLSGSYPKFVNYLQDVDNFPVPKSFDGTQLISKIDGSCMIVDYFNGQLNSRSRGTFSSDQLDNAADFKYVLNKYPNIETLAKRVSMASFLFEIVTPNQRIVIDYGPEIDIFLTGVVLKGIYNLAEQKSLDDIARYLEVKRPEYADFRSLDELSLYLENAKDIEGFCLYSRHGQVIHKLKAQAYLISHRLKSDIASLDKVIDLYLELNKPTFEEFSNFIKLKFDFELFKVAEANLRQACSSGEKAAKVLAEIGEFVKGLSPAENPSQKKESALKIIEKYKQVGLESYAFSLYNKQDISTRMFKILMEKA